MKSITASKFMRGNTKSAYDLVCTHAPVKITSDDRPDIIMVLATDYEEMRIKAQCYDTVKNQRDDADVKVKLLTTLIENLYIHFNDETTASTTAELIKIGV